jgi:hypothetical protein
LTNDGSSGQTEEAVTGQGALELIAGSLNFGDDSVFGMFTGYFDDAGGADHGYTVVAGWVSTMERWRAFAEQWRYMLAAFRVPWYDMKTLSHFRGVYETWKSTPERKDQFQAAACRIIAANVLAGFACLVEHPVFAKVNGAHRLKEYVGNEYALAGITVCHKMHDWIRIQERPAPFEIVFDDGTAKRGKLRDVIRREGFAEPIFRSPRSRNGMWPVIQLQAADFLAYEVRKAHATDPNEALPVEQHRITIRKLVWNESDWGSYSEASLIQACERHPRMGKRIAKQ